MLGECRGGPSFLPRAPRGAILAATAGQTLLPSPNGDSAEMCPPPHPPTPCCGTHGEGQGHAAGWGEDGPSLALGFCRGLAGTGRRHPRAVQYCDSVTRGPHVPSPNCAGCRDRATRVPHAGTYPQHPQPMVARDVTLPLPPATLKTAP